MRALLRHLFVVVVMLCLVGLFYAMRSEDLHAVHRWNRSWADASIVLAAGIFVVGGVARAWPRAAAALPWRREMGVWSVVAAIVHVGYYASSALDGNLLRFVQDAEHHAANGAPLGSLDWRRDAWAAANWVGIIALFYSMSPLLTSNDRSQRLLKAGWKRLQDQGRIYYVLAMLHFFLFWLLVYVPAQLHPGPVIFWLALSAVVLSQGFGFWRRGIRSA